MYVCHLITQKRPNRLGYTVYHWICLGPGLVLGFWKSGSGSRFAGKPVKTGLASSRNTIVLAQCVIYINFNVLMIGSSFLYKILQFQNFIRPDPVKKNRQNRKNRKNLSLWIPNMWHIIFHIFSWRAHF